MKDPNPDRFSDLISQLKECSHTFLEKALKEKGLVGLVPAHGQVLFPLFSSETFLTLGEIAKISGRAKSTITGMADTLEKYGYIKRISCPEDKRSVRVALTKKGLGIEQVFRDISRDLNETIFRNISEEDQRIMMNTLLRIKDNFSLIKKSDNTKE